MQKHRIFVFPNSIAANAISFFGVGSILIGILVALSDGMWATGIQYILIGAVLNVVAVILNKVEGNWKANRKAAQDPKDGTPQ